MKRQILFRGKRTDNGEWVEGDLIQLDNEVCITDKTMWATEFSRGTVELQCCQVHPESVGQFTGLTDRDGKRIFTDDLLSRDGDIYRIWMEPGKFLMGGVNKEWDDYINEHLVKRCEIIGNIHDNGINQ